MLFRRPTVPLDEDSSARFLPWLVAFMVFLACLALASVFVVERTAARWDSGLKGQLTVQIPAPDDATLRPARIEAVSQVLQATPGVRGISVLTPAEVARLVEPWLGEGAALAELPLPDLIAVTLDATAPPDLGRLQQALDAAVPGTRADDHQRWLANLLSLAASVQLGALIVVLLVGLAAVVTVIFVTRTGLEIHRQVIELLHLMGAQDSYIAREFQGHALKLGLRGGLFGFALAAAALFGLSWLARQAELSLLPRLELAARDWALLALLPVAAALIAMWTARVTVLRTLVRMS
jgi:cell division transport system permease protein